VDVCVIGAGYVGLVTSACLAYFGNKVVAVDVDERRLTTLRSGNIPFFEPGLEEFVKHGTSSGTLEFTADLASAVKRSDIVFIAVGTPSKPDGEPDLSQVMSAAKAIGGALDESRRRIIVNKSTVPVGSGNWVDMLVSQGLQAVQAVPARSAKVHAPSFSVVSNPEFLREGCAIIDSLYPDRILVGAGDDESVERMRQLYKPILDQTFEAPKFAPRPAQFEAVPFVVSDIPSAEMIKYSANAFLAMKISFANEMSGLCEKVGADISQVMRGIGLDSRIGSKFLNAGIGWGGSCFGKDINALIEVSREYNCLTTLLEATISVNKRQRMTVITKLQEELKIIKGRTVGLLGLSFKPDTDDLRDAPSLTIAAQLIKMGAEVKVFDPVSMEVCARMNPQLEVVYCQDVAELASGSDALVLITEWDEFRHADWLSLGESMRRPILIDGRNFLSEQTLRSAGFVYRGIGR
jgi:UDPglucose 6-dehydrogenase